MKFNTTKCKILHVGNKNILFQAGLLHRLYKIGKLKKVWRAIVEQSLSGSSQCVVAVKKANWMQRYIARSIE